MRLVMRRGMRRRPAGRAVVPVRPARATVVVAGALGMVVVGAVAARPVASQNAMPAGSPALAATALGGSLAGAPLPPQRAVPTDLPDHLAPADWARRTGGAPGAAGQGPGFGACVTKSLLSGLGSALPGLFGIQKANAGLVVAYGAKLTMTCMINAAMNGRVEADGRILRSEVAQYQRLARLFTIERVIAAGDTPGTEVRLATGSLAVAQPIMARLGQSWLREAAATSVASGVRSEAVAARAYAKASGSAGPTSAICPWSRSWSSSPSAPAPY
jgi:hypothetical protein